MGSTGHCSVSRATSCSVTQYVRRYFTKTDSHMYRGILSSDIRYTDMQEKAKARLRELAPTARGGQEAGFTQPSLHLFLHVCNF